MTWLYHLLAAIGISLSLIPVLAVLEPEAEDSRYDPAPGD